MRDLRIFSVSSGLAFVPIFLGACGELGEQRRFESSADPVEIIEAIPAPGSSSADPAVRFDLCLSTEVQPLALREFDLTLRSSTLVFDSDVSVQMFSWMAPGSRELLAPVRWCEGSVLSLTPISPLDPGVTYRVQMREISELGWAGGLLDLSDPAWSANEEGLVTRSFEFQVAGAIGDPAPQEVPALAPGPTLTELFEDQRVFDPDRGACGCHQSAGLGEELALARLDLSDPSAALTALLERGGLEATGFPMITPGEPSESYLLHKLHRSASGEGLHGIAGEPMPPGAPLPFSDSVDLAHWIASGAAP